MVLEQPTVLDPRCSIYSPGNCALQWRDRARRTVIVVTDEDSDLPVRRENWQNLQGASSLCRAYQSNGQPLSTGETCFEPSFVQRTLVELTRHRYNYLRNQSPMQLEPPYEMEILMTAEVLKRHRAQVFFLLGEPVISEADLTSYHPNSGFDQASYFCRLYGTCTKTDFVDVRSCQYGHHWIGSTLFRLSPSEILGYIRQFSACRHSLLEEYSQFCGVISVDHMNTQYIDSVATGWLAKMIEPLSVNQVCEPVDPPSNGLGPTPGVPPSNGGGGGSLTPVTPPPPGGGTWSPPISPPPGGGWWYWPISPPPSGGYVYPPISPPGGTWYPPVSPPPGGGTGTAPPTPIRPTPPSPLPTNPFGEVSGQIDIMFVVNLAANIDSFCADVVATLTYFVGLVHHAKLDARFAIVAYGGMTVLHMPFVVFIFKCFSFCI